MYVDQSVGQDTVNTLPPATIESCADHCDVGDCDVGDCDVGDRIETAPTVKSSSLT
jgi:hypothetical protein